MHIIHEGNSDAETSQSRVPKNQRKRRLKGPNGRRKKKHSHRARHRNLKDKDGNKLTSRTIPEILAGILGEDSKGPEKRPGRDGRIPKRACRNRNLIQFDYILG